MELIKGKKPKPRKILLYGPNFSGKSTQAASFDGVIFLDTESSLDDIDCVRTPLLTSIGDVYDAIAHVGKNEAGNYQWLAIDSIDWVEKLIQDQVARDAGVESFGDKTFDYGRGRKLCRPYWSRLIKGLSWVHETCNMGLILIAHDQKVDVKPADKDSYQRIEPALDTEARDMLCDWCTELLYISPEPLFRDADDGFSRTRKIAVKGEQRRFIQTRMTTGVRAKNRLELPLSIECTGVDTLAKAIGV